MTTKTFKPVRYSTHVPVSMEEAIRRIKAATPEEWAESEAAAEAEDNARFPPLPVTVVFLPND